MNPEHVSFPVRFFVADPGGPVPLSPDRADHLLPRGPEAREPALKYGPYLDAVRRFLERDGWGVLVCALRRHDWRRVCVDAIRGVRIISEKHGAAYNVARVVVELDADEISFAVSCAADVLQRSQAAAEVELLHALQRRFGLPFLPRLHASGEGEYVEEGGVRRPLALFITEWFEGFHEFHLTRVKGETAPRVVVWDVDRGGHILGPEDESRLYERASAILTAYFDPETFEQIHPWHHAAGDFVLRRDEGGELDLRLVTARGYRSLFAPGADPGDLWIALIHFFLNLTLRMRMDRLDGTGHLVLADTECLGAVLRGFLNAWDRKAATVEGLPKAEDILDIFRSFSEDELLSLLELVLEDGTLQPEEAALTTPRLKEHARALMALFGSSGA